MSGEPSLGQFAPTASTQSTLDAFLCSAVRILLSLPLTLILDILLLSTVKEASFSFLVRMASKNVFIYTNFVEWGEGCAMSGE